MSASTLRRVRYAVIDTETSGLFDFKLPADAVGQPRLAHLASIYVDENAEVLDRKDFYVRPDGWRMSAKATEINGLTTEFLRENGVPIGGVLDRQAQCDPRRGAEGRLAQGLRSRRGDGQRRRQDALGAARQDAEGVRRLWRKARADLYRDRCRRARRYHPRSHAGSDRHAQRLEERRSDRRGNVLDDGPSRLQRSQGTERKARRCRRR
ncbi:hypothetical protein HNS03_08340 [Amorphus sp. 3PC139-8]